MIFLDFETYYSNEYSLLKITIEEYVRSSQFEVIGLSVQQTGMHEPEWFSGSRSETAAWLQQFDFEGQACAAHNAAFDMSILEWRFNRRPKFVVDTMAMGAAVLGMHCGTSLKALADWFELPPKGTAVVNAKGMHRADMESSWLRAYAEYCRHDTWLCREIFKRLQRRMPTSEMALIDWTVRAFTQPRLQLNKIRLAEIVAVHRRNIESLRGAIGEDPSALRSDEILDFLLRQYKVAITPTVTAAGNRGYGFNKQNPEFLELLGHDNPMVVSLVEARLAAKSSLSSSRAERLLGISERGALPYPLRYYGAANTGRWSGDGRINLQNLPRSGGLRESVIAPPGMLIATADLAQIELRVNMFNAGDGETLGALRAGRDVYADTASDIYGYAVTKSSHPLERFVGKVTELSAGYQCGAERFLNMLRVAARREGITLDDESIDFAQRVITGYRRKHPRVKALWYGAHDLLPTVAAMGDGSYGCIEVVAGEVVLPNGLVLTYPELHQAADGEWHYTRQRSRAQVDDKLYGGKLVENWTQAFARIVMSDALLELDRFYPVVGTVHDEIIMLVPSSSDLDSIRQHIFSIMTAPVDYLPGLPLSAEIKFGENYAEAK